MNILTRKAKQDNDIHIRYNNKVNNDVNISNDNNNNTSKDINDVNNTYENNTNNNNKYYNDITVVMILFTTRIKGSIKIISGQNNADGNNSNQNHYH